MWHEGQIRAVAGRCNGLIDRQTVLNLGASDHNIQDRLHGGQWLEVHPGVYYLNVTPRTWITDVGAAAMAAGPDAVASHRTAAVLWGLEGVFGGVIELTVPISNGPIPAEIIVHRSRRPPPGETVDGLPVTTVERTILDLAALMPDRALEKVAESALRRHLTSLAELAEILKTNGGRGVKGTRRMRRVVMAVDRDITGSPAEFDVHELIRSAPVPPPILQLRIDLPNGQKAFPDFSWPRKRRIVEVDGFEAHSTPEQLQHDLNRQNMLLELGWEIRRFTARDVRLDPDRIRAEIVRFING
jgi:hypothetical protein